MRFIIGLLLGLGLGFVATVVLTSGKNRHREAEGAESGEEGFGENHDTMAGLRRAMQGLQEQMQEALKEAREAAREAEKEMRARYARDVPKPGRERS